MLITKNMKMADIIHLNYQLLPVINRFGIELGFGNLCVCEVCEKHKIPVGFFLEIVNTFHDENYFPDKQLQMFSVSLIVDYLKRTHHYYLENKLPRIENLINQLVEQCSDTRKKYVFALKKFFNQYRQEIYNHIKREEEVVYPYVYQIEKAIQDEQVNEKLNESMKTYSIKNFAIEHENVSEKLYDLKNIIIMYLPPPKNTDLCNTILFEVFMLEKDLDDHQRIEDKVLIPKIMGLEKKLQLLKS